MSSALRWGKRAEGALIDEGGLLDVTVWICLGGALLLLASLGYWQWGKRLRWLARFYQEAAARKLTRAQCEPLAFDWIRSGLWRKVSPDRAVALSCSLIETERRIFAEYADDPHSLTHAAGNEERPVVTARQKP